MNTLLVAILVLLIVSSTRAETIYFDYVVEGEDTNAAIQPMIQEQTNLAAEAVEDRIYDDNNDEKLQMNNELSEKKQKGHTRFNPIIF